MVLDLFTEKAGSALSRALDAYAFRHRVIANNIANAETPGFTRSDADFESDLKAALQAGDANTVKKRLADVRATLRVDNQSPRRPDGNNVNIDFEMANLAKNSLSYRAAATLMDLRTAIMRYVIAEGRR